MLAGFTTGETQCPRPALGRDAVAPKRLRGGRIDMTVRIGVNGFGRIGRNLLRAIIELEGASEGDVGVELVAINDIMPLEVNAHLLRYDSTHGRLGVPVEVTDHGLRVAGRHIAVVGERAPK